jgi:hypothetical protein
MVGLRWQLADVARFERLWAFEDANVIGAALDAPSLSVSSSRLVRVEVAVPSSNRSGETWRGS